jgi:hypothetical protein
VVLCFINAEGGQQGVQQLPGTADKGQSLFVLFGARSFADQQERRLNGSAPDDYMGSLLPQLTFFAGRTGLYKLPPILFTHKILSVSP